MSSQFFLGIHSVDSFGTSNPWTVINAQITKRDNAGGIVHGWHGTSLKRGLQIQSRGFENYRCVEGEFGVHFHDNGFSRNAKLHAWDKAKKEGDDGYAIILGRLRSPRPDLARRYQWVVDACNIEVISVDLFDLDHNPIPNPVSGKPGRSIEELDRLIL